MQPPSKTVEFLDLLKARKGFSSDYQLWKYLGWKQTTVSSYRRGRSAMSAPHAMRVADELGLPHAYVVACMQAEREGDAKVAGVWKAIADHFRSAAAVILIALAGLGAGQDAHAAQGFPALQSESNLVAAVYILRSLMRWLAWGLRTMFPAVMPMLELQVS